MVYFKHDMVYFKHDMVYFKHDMVYVEHDMIYFSQNWFEVNSTFGSREIVFFLNFRGAYLPCLI